MAKFNQDAKREHARLRKEYQQAQERYRALVPHAAESGSPRAVAVAVAFSEKDLELVQQADLQRLMAREALDRFRATHGMA